MAFKKQIYILAFFYISIIFSSCVSVENRININQVFLSKSQIIFLTPDAAAKILATEDEYIKSFSKFDYASKMKVRKNLNFDERYKFYKKACLNWETKDIHKIVTAINSLNDRVIELKLSLPSQILLIKTNGEEEGGHGGAAYTRGISIAFPEKFIKNMNQYKFNRLFAHELFHIYSRYAKNLRETMYKVIKYEKCTELQFPSELKDLKISNPDAPHNNYFISCNYKNKKYDFIPILYSKKPYDIDKRESFFKYLNDDMLAVEVVDSVPRPIYVNNKLLIVNKKALSGFYEKIGKNTKYTFHPEETIADNFVFLIFKDKVPSPQIISTLEKVLKGLKL